MLQYRGNVRTAQLAVSQARLKLLPLLGRQPDDDPRRHRRPARHYAGADGPDLPALQQAAQTRPDLLALRTDQARIAGRPAAQQAQGKVDYTVGAEYRRQQGVNGKGNMLGFFVSVPLPVFNRNQGEIARADAERERPPFAGRARKPPSPARWRRRFEEFESARSAPRRHRTRSAAADREAQRRHDVRLSGWARPPCSTCSTPSGRSTTPWTRTTPRRPPTGGPRRACPSPSTRTSP